MDSVPFGLLYLLNVVWQRWRPEEGEEKKVAGILQGDSCIVEELLVLWGWRGHSQMEFCHLEA